MDHRTPWQRHGETNEHNLLTLCRRHHHAKHDAGWTPDRLPDGTIEWTSPTGRTYLDEPATYPVDQTVELSEPAEQPEAATTDPPPF